MGGIFTGGAIRTRSAAARHIGIGGGAHVDTDKIASTALVVVTGQTGLGETTALGHSRMFRVCTWNEGLIGAAQVRRPEILAVAICAAERGTVFAALAVRKA